MLGFPDGRLGWLLNFAQRPSLEFEHSGKKQLAKIRAEVEQFAARAPTTGRRERTSLSPEELAEIATTVGQGIEEVRHGALWRLGPDDLKGLTRFVGSRGKGENFLRYDGDLRTRFLMVAADLVEAEGDRIRRCAGPECGRLFVKRKRGAYCGTPCSQRMRTNRFLESHPKTELAAKRHEYYRRKIARERGPKIAAKIRRRGTQTLQAAPDGGKSDGQKARSE